MDKEKRWFTQNHLPSMVLDLVFEFKPTAPRRPDLFEWRSNPPKPKQGSFGLQEVIYPDVMLWCLEINQSTLDRRRPRCCWHQLQAQPVISRLLKRMIHGIIGITFTSSWQNHAKPFFLALFPRQTTDSYAYYGIVIIVHMDLHAALRHRWCLLL